MSDDSEWMREVFDTTRGEEEPIWFADARGMIGAGDRRRRRRGVGAGGGSLAVIAVAATVAVSVAAPGGGGRSTTAPPATSPGTTPVTAPATTLVTGPTLSGGTFLDRVYFIPLEFKNLSLVSSAHPAFIDVPEPAVADMKTLLSGVDPTSSHIVPNSIMGAPNKAVPFGDPYGDNLAGVQIDSAWTPDGKGAAVGGVGLPDGPNGNLITRILDGDDPKFQAAMPGCGAADDVAETWATLDPDPARPDGADRVAWSGCEQTRLGDGSVLASSTKTFGKYTAVFVTRQFPGGAGSVETLWLNYSIQSGLNQGIGPNPATVLSPSPLTVDKIKAVLSGTGIAPGLKAATTVTVPPTLLQAADFGTGWRVDSSGAPTRPSNMVTDACATDQSDLLGPTVPDYTFSGPTPSGLNVRADVLRLTVKAGAGAQKLADLRKQAQSGCATATVTALPDGIGDGGFVENIPGLPSKPWNVFVRFGDVVIQVYVNSPESSPSFTQADKQWLAGLAPKVATRFAAKG